MTKKLLFPQLSREHAIALERMVNNYSSSEEREQQVHALGVFLTADGLPYNSRAVLKILEDLAPYTTQCLTENAPGFPIEFIRVHHLMFRALDDCLDNIIKEHWEVAVWTDSEGTDIKYCSTFYTQEEAYKEYHAERIAGECARLARVDEVTHDFETLEATWMETK